MVSFYLGRERQRAQKENGSYLFIGGVRTKDGAVLARSPTGRESSVFLFQRCAWITPIAFLPSFQHLVSAARVFAVICM